MSELLLDSSERRTPRVEPAPRPGRHWVRPLLISGACAAVLAGFGVAAASVVSELVSPAAPARGPVIGTGAAASWPDLKDGLPALAGTPVKVTTSTKPVESAPRMAALSEPLAYAASPATAPVAPPTTPASRPAPVPPAVQIPKPTEVAAVAPPPLAKIVMPTRTVATIGPRPNETLRARDEAVRPAEAAAKPREEAPRIREASTEKPIAAAHPPPPVRPTSVAKAAPSTNPVPEKAPKPVAVRKPAATPAVPVKTASAEAETEETEILGVKIPSLAPAGRKIKDSVSALGDAVRNAF